MSTGQASRWKALAGGMAVVAGLFTTATALGADIQNVSAKQRYPWNGLVDIRFTATGIGEGVAWPLALAAVEADSDNVRELSHFWVVRDGTASTDRAVQADGEYELLWDARADLGETVCSNMVVQVALEPHPMVRLWEGGPYWADRNVGADDPWDCGLFFWWGDTVGYERETNQETGQWVASDGSSTNYSFKVAPHYGKNSAWLLKEGWIATNNVLVPGHDAARAHWGGEWRMPTKRELQDLVDKCDRTWMATNGVRGYLVRGRDGYASASIFLPAAGFGTGTDLKNGGAWGYLWSSEPNTDPNEDNKDNSYLSWRLNFKSTTFYMDYHYDRHVGTSCRPVRGGSE